MNSVVTSHPNHNSSGPTRCVRNCRGDEKRVADKFQDALHGFGGYKYVGVCGGGVMGNGICEKENECCSSFGYCGTTIDYCGTNVCIGGCNHAGDSVKEGSYNGIHFFNLTTRLPFLDKL
jgi:hypothetical protein